LLAAGCNLDRKNPRAKEDITHRPPEALVQDILAKEHRIVDIMSEIAAMPEKGKDGGRDQNG
jgi:type I restriction enzyme M protein